MKILLLSKGIFDAVGGGQVLYRHVILSNPQHHFYVPAPKGTPLPENCTGYDVTDFFSRYMRPKFEQLLPAREYAKHQIFTGMDYAASVSGQHFDIVDIPDYINLDHTWPEIFREFGVHADKWLLSAHGTLTNAFENHWWPVHQTALREILDEELETRKIFHGVYGFSKSYLERYAALGFQTAYVNPRHMYAPQFEAFRASGANAPRPGKPQLTFLGRLDLCKSPPKFAEVVSKIDPNLYDKVNIWGSDVIGPHGQSALEEMKHILARRGIDCTIETLPHALLLERLRTENHLIIAPSVYETLHLGALESLSLGSPCIISAQSGFIDLIETFEQAEQFIAYDLNTRPLSHQVTRALENWPETQRNWLALAEKVYAGYKDRDFGGLYGSIEWSETIADPAEHAGDIWEGFQPEKLSAFHQILDERYQAHIRNENPSPYLTFKKQSLPNFLTLLYRYSYADAQILPNDLKRGIRPLFGSAYYLYGTVLLARMEMAEGNREHAVAYFLRADRAGYTLRPDEESYVQKALEACGYLEEAKLFPHRHDPGYIFDYLQQRRRLPCQYADRQVVADHRSEYDPDTADITFICTTLNAENKVSNFVTGLVDAVAPFDGCVEFLLIESASTDRTCESFVENLETRAPANLCWRILKTDQKETIQSAWNRAVERARGKYFNFIGIDEVMFPEGLKRLYTHMEAHPQTDWVVGNATVHELDKTGLYVKDGFHYDRSMTDRFDIILESTKSGMVGTLIRKSLFERTGYFDPRYFCAGDNEHKLRILPFAETDCIPFTCGSFSDWPEARVTASTRAEIEDFTAWYLFRTIGGIRYILQNQDEAYASQLHDRTYSFTKSYKYQESTDISLARTLAEAYALESELADQSRRLFAHYTSRYTELKTGLDIPALLLEMAKIYIEAQQDVEPIPLPNGGKKDWSPRSDNLHEQHSWVWPHPAKSKSSDLAQAEIQALEFIRAKYRNRRQYAHVVLSRSLSLLIGDTMPSRITLTLLHRLWTARNLQHFLQTELSTLHNSWRFGDCGAMAERIVQIFGFQTDHTSKPVLIASPLLSARPSAGNTDTIGSWLRSAVSSEDREYVDDEAWEVAERPILDFTGPLSGVRFKGIRDTDLNPRDVLSGAVQTSANKVFSILAALACRQAISGTVTFKDCGQNTETADFEVYVNGTRTRHAFKQKGEGGALVFEIPPVLENELALPVTEVSIRLASTSPDPRMKQAQYGVVFDSLSLRPGSITD